MCCRRRAWQRAIEVAAVVATWKKWRFVTLTVDGTAYEGKQLEILRHLRARRAVAHVMKELRRRGLVGQWIRAMEFQENGQVHFHLIVETLTPTGYVSRELIQQLWGYHRPEWAGPVALFEDGTLAGQPRPGVGWADVRRTKGRLGDYAAIVGYMTKYVGAPGKNDVPEFFLDEVGKGNAQMFSSSRGFWKGVRKPRPKRERVGKPQPRIRRHVRDRMASCREQFTLLEKIEVMSAEGEILKPKYRVLGRSQSALAFWWANEKLLPGHPDIGSEKSGFFVSMNAVERLAASKEIDILWTGPRPRGEPPPLPELRGSPTVGGMEPGDDSEFDLRDHATSGARPWALAWLDGLRRPL